MNVLLWIVQIALAVLYLAGGAYKTFSFDELAKQLNTLPRGAWGALGVVEMLGAVLLIVPAATRWMPALTPIAAAALALETLAIAAVYARYSLAVAATNPLVWGPGDGHPGRVRGLGPLRGPTGLTATRRRVHNQIGSHAKRSMTCATCC